MSPQFLRASLLFDQGRFLEAEAEFRAALAAGDDSAELHAMLGLCLKGAGLPDAARQEVLRALEKDPGCAYAHYARSFVGGGIPSALRAVELAPEDAEFLVRLAGLYQATQQWQQSLPPAEAALRLDPQDVGAAALRAEALTHLGRRREARETLLRALESNPEASAAHAGLGWALLRAGDHRRAAQFFDEALRLRPELDWAQKGALECAKYQYWLYRLLSFPAQRLAGRPALRLLANTGAALVLLLAVCAAMRWLGPALRPHFGADGAALMVTLPLVLLGTLVFSKDSLFIWLVQRHRAAQSSAALHQRRKAAVVLIALTTGLLAATLSLGLQHRFPSAVLALLGLVPGVLSLSLTLWETPAVEGRGWLLLYGAMLCVAGPVIAVVCRSYIELLEPNAWWLMVLPVIPVAIADANLKRKDRERRHQQQLKAIRSQSQSR
jgi:tetratricopeptide (TPR) repeat protein